MKKYFLLVVSAVALAFTSCSDSEEIDIKYQVNVTVDPSSVKSAFHGYSVNDKTYGLNMDETSKLLITSLIYDNSGNLVEKKESLVNDYSSSAKYSLKIKEGEWIFDNEEVSDAFGEVVVTGNSTLAQMHISRSDVFVYYPTVNDEAFLPMEEDDEQTIFPTAAFLYGYVPKNNEGMPARRVKRTGEIVYDKENTPTDVNPGGNIPTVGGGNDLFITSTVEGINIAVAQPQQVRVMSATGAIIYSGMVQTAVDVALPATGVYVITGENEVHKILH